MSAVPLLQGAGLAGLVLATFFDLKARLIPNATVFWVLAAGGLARVVADGPAAWVTLALGLAVFIPLAMLAHRDLIGGGDAKMIAATTFLVEPRQTPGLLIAIILCGGVLAAAWWIGVRLWPRPRPGSDTDVGPTSTSLHEQLPYGVAILAGAALTLVRFA